MNKALYLLISIPMFLLGMILVMIMPLIKIENKPTTMIVFDAGSNATSVYIYNVQNKSELVQQSAQKITPALSSFAGKSYEEVSSYMKPLLDFINDNVDKDQKNKIPVYFAATAGLRLIDQQQSEKLLSFVRHMLSQTRFVFRDEQLELMEGSDEGAKLWLTVNYLYKTLQTKQFVGTHYLDEATTQLSFVAQDNNQKGYQLKFRGESFKLYEHSYLGYGMNSARDLFESKLSVVDANGDVVNPCLPKDFKKQSEVLGKQMVGSSDLVLCSQTVSSLFDKSKCTHSSCSFNDVYQPKIGSNDKFISRGSNVESTANFMKVSFNSATSKALREAAEKVCSMDHATYLSTYNEEPQNFCFQALYISSLWKEGFGFEEERVVEITDKINKYDVSWALGHALMKYDNYPKTNYIIYTAGEPAYFAMLAAGGCMILISAILFGMFFARPNGYVQVFHPVILYLLPCFFSKEDFKSE